MLVRDVIDLVEQKLQNLTTKKVIGPERSVLRNYLSLTITELAEREDFDFFTVYLDPVAKTYTNRRSYPLPKDFGYNFIRVGQATSRNDPTHVCKLSDGNNEASLSYVPLKDFFARNLEAESAGRPKDYTIVSTPAGTRELYLSPKPDSNSDAHYTVTGAYVPNFRVLDEDDQLMPVPGGFAYFVYDVLLQVKPDEPLAIQKQKQARQALYRQAAKNQDIFITPSVDIIRNRHV